LKTLALIAFHQPVKQSNLRRMIGPKVYDHVDELSAMKLINAKKHGTTEMLTTTKLFPEYFGIDTTKPEEIREFLAKKVIASIEK
jgi:segregation and condensation protein B